MSANLPTVLVVDDEPRSLETLRRTLEEEFEVLTAESADLLSPGIVQGADEQQSEDISILSQTEGSLKKRMEALEARIVKETMIRHRWNKTRAAEELSLSRVGLRGKLERYGLEKVEGMEKLEANGGQ